MATARAKGLIFEDWLRDRCVRNVDVSTLHAALYRDYCRHAGAAALGAQAFARALEAAGIKALKLPGGQHRRGVRLREHPGGAEMIERIDMPSTPAREQASAVALAARGLSRTSGEGVDEITVKLDVQGMVRAPDAAPLWQLTPITPGQPPEMGLMLEIKDAADEASARVAHELFEERQRQKAKGYTPADDDALAPGELASMAAACAFAASVPTRWTGWLRGRGAGPNRELDGAHILGVLQRLWLRSLETFKAAEPRALLVRAGGLIIAAIETIDRANARKAQEQGRG